MQAAAPLLQHDAPIFLGSLSSWAGGCTTRCNDPATFRYIATGEGVTVYIVDGVRTYKLTLLVISFDVDLVVDWTVASLEARSGTAHELAHSITRFTDTLRGVCRRWRTTRSSSR